MLRVNCPGLGPYPVAAGDLALLASELVLLSGSLVNPWHFGENWSLGLIREVRPAFVTMFVHLCELISRRTAS